MSTVQDFDKEVKAVVTKGKLSPTVVQSVVDLALANISSDAHLISTLFRAHKKALAANKLVSLYLVDAISREARTRAKKALKEKGAAEPDAEPEEGKDAKGTPASFLAKVEGVLSKIVLDCWENGLREHREKVRKVLDIWTKAGTFSAISLARISNKLLASNSETATPAPAPAPAVAPTPLPDVQRTAEPAPPTPAPSTSGTAPAGIPASVLALLAATSQPLAPSVQNISSDIQQAIADARAGIVRPLPPTPSQTSLSQASSSTLTPTLVLDPAQLALLRSVASASGQASPSAPSPPPPQSNFDQSNSQFRPTLPPPQDHFRNNDFAGSPSQGAYAGGLQRDFSGLPGQQNPYGGNRSPPNRGPTGAGWNGPPQQQQQQPQRGNGPPQGEWRGPLTQDMDRREERNGSGFPLQGRWDASQMGDRRPPPPTGFQPPPGNVGPQQNFNGPPSQTFNNPSAQYNGGPPLPATQHNGPPLQLNGAPGAFGGSVPGTGGDPRNRGNTVGPARGGMSGPPHGAGRGGYQNVGGDQRTPDGANGNDRKRRWDEPSSSGSQPFRPPPPAPAPGRAQVPSAPGLDEFGRAIRPNAEDDEPDRQPYRRKPSSPSPPPPQRQPVPPKPYVAPSPAPAPTPPAVHTPPHPPTPFDFSKFNAVDPSCWSAFAEYCRLTWGRTPSNQEMAAMVMSQMAGSQMAMHQGAVGGGGMPAPGMNGMNGMGRPQQ